MAKILLIDDEQDVASVFKTALTKGGFEVHTASSGREGIEAAKKDAYDLILLDQMMPDLSGEDVLKTLKADSVTKNIKVVMLSNFGQNELVQNALKEGAADYIFKYQVAPEDLVEKVKSIVG